MKRVAAIAFVGVALGGCSDPYAHTPRGASPPSPRPMQAPESATTTARAFARHWVNWDWRSAAPQQRALAELAAGRLASDLRTSATSARIDASLARDKPSVRGDVVVVHLATRDSRATGLVVTREQRYTAGRADLGGSRHRVYAITLARNGARWEVSAWKPQP